MASYHINISTGAKGAALEHAQYIDRDGPFTEERYGEVAARGHANMPAWAREDTAKFWRASDAHERANGNTYREYELALPRELSSAARVALVERFAEQEFGVNRPYQWAIHTCTARDGKEQPHVHLMFSDRQQDGIERGPEQFFKRYNAKDPERGGARKFSYGDRTEAALVYEGIRERWAKVQNLALEAAGVEARVDHRSLAAQGIHREPGVHRGPAVSGIEGRGHVSEVGQRQREQMLERSEARDAVDREARLVTREEVSVQRVAARERREIAREVTGADRARVMPLVEADRREQIARAAAQAERRIERRRGLGGRVGEKLLAQARALRERIAQQVGRMKEWLAQQFPDGLKQVRERMGDLFGGKAPEQKAGETIPLDLKAVKAQGRAAGERMREKLHQRQAEQRRAEEARQAQERARQMEVERMARDRAAASKRRELEQQTGERALSSFKQLAASRDMKQPGFSDKSEKWQATPESLRKAIDDFNRLPPLARKAALERLMQDPQKVRSLEGLIDERMQRVRDLGRGLGR